jgi:hypothetical protein
MTNVINLRILIINSKTIYSAIFDVLVMSVNYDKQELNKRINNK